MASRPFAKVCLAFSDQKQVKKLKVGLIDSAIKIKNKFLIVMLLS